VSSSGEDIFAKAAKSVLDHNSVRETARTLGQEKGALERLRERERWYDEKIDEMRAANQGGFPGFAARHLRIKDKSGTFRPLILNRAQLYVHALAEKQVTLRGYVRMIVLKGRQMGLSTMIGGRGYKKVIRSTGQSAYILAHELTATNNLFAMVKRYHDNMPPMMRPHTRRSNEKTLVFDRLNGGYTVGTAKASETGRSLTQQFFHGSEVAFWPPGNDIVSGVMQAIGSVRGTEIWLESTANGIGNFFHTITMMAMKGENDFEVAFCPWFWDEGYQTPPEQIPKDFEASMTMEDIEYADVHGLNLGQMHWRSKKIAEFAATEDGTREAGTFKFGQEYPAIPEEAFLGDTANAFVRAIVIMKARKNWADYVKVNGHPPIGVGPKVLGIDPSYTGPDKFSIWARQGRVAWKAGGWQKQRNKVSAGRCVAIFDKEQPDAIFIDIGNTGGPLYDDLCETKWKQALVPVLFGDPADEPDRFYNKRCEMWGRGREWLADIPTPYLEDRQDIQADLTSIQTKASTKPNQLKLESKEEMRKRKVPSPDDGDAFGLTFAYDAAPRGSTNAPDPHRAITFGGGLNVPGRG
jgi:hypothetical protein